MSVPQSSGHDDRCCLPHCTRREAAATAGREEEDSDQFCESPQQKIAVKSRSTTTHFFQSLSPLNSSMNHTTKDTMKETLSPFFLICIHQSSIKISAARYSPPQHGLLKAQLLGQCHTKASLLLLILGHYLEIANKTGF